MKDQLDWQVGTDDGGWETITNTYIPPARKARWHLWGTATVALVLCLAGACLAVRQMYVEALHQITYEIQDAIDQETQTMMGGGSHPAHLVQNVEMRGDTAWAEVSSDQGRGRQVRFYQRTDRGWEPSPSVLELWGYPVKLDAGAVVVRCHERDLPYVRPLVEPIFRSYAKLSTLLGEAGQPVLEVDFAVDGDAESLPKVSGNTLTLLSPWLTGVSTDGTWDEDHLERLAYWVNYAGWNTLMDHWGIERSPSVDGSEYAEEPL